MKQRLAELKILVMQEKRKAGVLAFLGLVLIGVLGRAFLSMGPRTGQASMGDTAGGLSSLAHAGQAAVSRAIASEDARHGGKTFEVPASPRLTRNLFALNPSQFPPPPQATAPESSQTVNSAAPVESMRPNADDDPRLAEMRLVEETNGWRLRSIILGAKPTAVVETAAKRGGASRKLVLSEGQFLENWKVIEITVTSVVFEKNSVRVRLSYVTQDR